MDSRRKAVAASGHDWRVITSAGFHAQGLAILEPEHAQLIKARLTCTESMAGLAGVEDIGREVGQGLADEIGGKSVDDLALFIVPLCGAKGTSTRAAA